MTSTSSATCSPATADLAALNAARDTAAARLDAVQREQAVALLAAAAAAARQLLPGAAGAVVTIDHYDGYHVLDALVAGDGTTVPLYQHPLPDDGNWDAPLPPENFHDESFCAIETVLQTVIELGVGRIPVFGTDSHQVALDDGQQYVPFPT